MARLAFDGTNRSWSVFWITCAAIGMVGVPLCVAVGGEPSSGETPPAKLRVPPAAELRRAQAGIRQSHQEELSRKEPAQRWELAQKLLVMARDAKRGTAMQFALFTEASRLLAELGVAEAACEAIDDLGESYAVDVLGLKATALEKSLESAAENAGGIALSQRNVASAAIALGLADDARAANRASDAMRLLRIALRAAEKSGDTDLSADVQSRMERLERVVESGKISSKGYSVLGEGFGTRGAARRTVMLYRHGGNSQADQAVATALTWLARHQNPQDGSWQPKKYSDQCRDLTCGGSTEGTHVSGTTAMGLLPFLAAGQTHKMKGPYQRTVAAGVNWLIRNQKPDGDLRVGSNMYSHGLATMALCEAYGLSGDKNAGMAALGAVNFILTAQNKTTGGWRYSPGDPGDTSVLGWQIMALKSAKMAGLPVAGSGGAFEGGSKWLDACAKGPAGSQCSYVPDAGPSPTMTSVGLLCRQHLGAQRENAMLAEGMKYLMNNLPDARFHNTYYWYYATQVLYNTGGEPWRAWNRKMRDLLVDTQCKDRETCACGSWDPEKDQWGKIGGRLMITSLSVLTLEIYYRYAPLYELDRHAATLGGK